jgi:hypothetical protein
MATLASNVLTLADWAKRRGTDDSVAAVCEILSQTNEVLEDCLFMEGNLPTGHKTTVRTGLPSATWRLLNYGVPKAKSTTAPVIDTCGNLEVYAEVDKDLADLNGNTAEFRMSETRAFLEGMSQQVASTMFYGNTATNPERFMGFAPRYNTINTATAQTAANVVSAGGTGTDNTSIWLVSWGDRTVFGLYPKSENAGFEMENLGVITETVNGLTNRYYKTEFTWRCGLCVKDWRYVVRICNIDVSDVAAGSVPLFKYLRQAFYKLRQREVIGGQAVIYCNSQILEALDALATNSGTTDNYTRLSYREVEGGEILTYRGIPIRQCDAILNTEAVVS